MNVNRRTELANNYFEAIDNEAYDDLQAVFSNDVVYKFPGQESIRGVENVLAFFKEKRPTKELVHEVTRWVHDEDVTVIEGVATGTGSRDSTEAYFCDVVAFDEQEDRITELAVYSRSEGDN